MDDRVMQFRVGVVFLATLLITGILLALFGKLPFYLGRYYTVRIRFTYAQGVSQDTPVRKNGIRIGKVTDVELTDNDSKVLVTVQIQADKKIYTNEVPCITRDLLGDTAISFLPEAEFNGERTGEKLMSARPGQKPAKPEPIAPGTILQGYILEDPTGIKKALEAALKSPINTVNSTGEALTAASKKLGDAAQRIEEIFDPETQQNAKSVLRDAAASLRTVHSILGDEENRKKLAEALQKLPETFDNMNHTFRSTEQMLSQFTQRSSVDGKTPIERMIGTIELTERTLRKFSEPAREGEMAPTDQIAKAMENINDITGLIRTIVTRIEQGEGSLGALMNDRQLYERLNRAARNIEEVSRQLKPIVDDARVFSDKIARHPGVIVRDAVKPGIGLK
jgi:phospholipid/cholesterol/gamma-HCH transport system substrate-binding protein